jgi:hypothetical protein
MSLKIPEGGSHDSNLLSVGCANQCIYARQRIREQGRNSLSFYLFLRFCHAPCDCQFERVDGDAPDVSMHSSGCLKILTTGYVLDSSI